MLPLSAIFRPATRSQALTLGGVTVRVVRFHHIGLWCKISRFFWTGGVIVRVVRFHRIGLWCKISHFFGPGVNGSFSQTCFVESFSWLGFKIGCARALHSCRNDDFGDSSSSLRMMQTALYYWSSFNDEEEILASDRHIFQKIKKLLWTISCSFLCLNE